MDLLPEKLKNRLPFMGSDSELDLRRKTVYARYFDPSSGWKWFVLEFDQQDTFFGIIVTGSHAMVGQFTLTELKSLRYHDPRLGEIGVELDPDFQPASVEELARTLPVILEIFSPSGLDLVSLD